MAATLKLIIEIYKYKKFLHMKVSGGIVFSKKEAIIIFDCTNQEGVNQEYLEIRKRFKEYKLGQQSLLVDTGKLYDKLELIVENGKHITVFFDITDFFGKWD
jgi:hypothetical protein